MFKEYLYTFCGKRKVTPSYSYEASRGGFCCDVVVPGITFLGRGVAKSKKEAQGEAAKNFCEQLVKLKIVSPSSLPAPIDVHGVSTSSAVPTQQVHICGTGPFPGVRIVPTATPTPILPPATPTQSTTVSPHDSMYSTIQIILCLVNYLL